MALLSPLRYPGGKGRWWRVVARALAQSGLLDSHYIEPFAGGAGLALELLRRWFVKMILLNDLDFPVYCFWKCATERTDQLIRFVRSVRVNMDEWYRMKEIYAKGRSGEGDLFEIACAFLFLNRTNHSGILSGAPIGGYAQNGRWKMDVRFNRDVLAAKLETIGSMRRRIQVCRMDGVDLISQLEPTQKDVIFADPPYYRNGHRLYLACDDHAWHERLGSVLQEETVPWILTYDDVEDVRKIYRQYRPTYVNVKYSAREKRVASEVVFTSRHIRFFDLRGTAALTIS